MKSAVLATSIVFALLASSASHAELIVLDSRPHQSVVMNAEVARSHYSTQQQSTQQQSSQQQSSQQQSSQQQSSQQQSSQQLLSGWANNVPLELALQQIVPSNFTVHANGVDLSRRVSWRGGQSWTEVLAGIARQSRFVTSVDWSRHTIVMSPIMVPRPLATARSISSGPTILAGPSIVTGPAPQYDAPPSHPTIYRVPPQPSSVSRPVYANVEQSSDERADQSGYQSAPSSTSADSFYAPSEPSVARVYVSPQPHAELSATPVMEAPPVIHHVRHVTQQQPAYTAPSMYVPASASASMGESVERMAPARQPSLDGPQEWTLSPALTLRENVEAWAKKVGWKLVWSAADYPIAAEAKFYGDFTSPDGPLSRLISAYEGSDQPLIARLSTLDKVVNVVNKNYNPAEVELKSIQENAPDSFKSN
jgi:hypothetical protein